jgi:dolichyl-phosphate-mannose--protein O-mannosyl transferase
MLMDLGISITGSNKNIDTHHLAEVKKLDDQVKLPEHYDFTGIRLMAGLFSVVGALLFYFIMLSLLGESFEAFVFSLLFLFENAFIVHFRAAHLDPYQMTFTLGSILVWLSTFGRAPKRPLLTYAAFGLLCGLSFMVKVNSLVMLALGAMSLGRALYADRTLATLKTCVVRGLSVLAAFSVTVAAVFSLHVVLNPVSPNPESFAGKSYLSYMGPTAKAFYAHKIGLSPAVIFDVTKGYYDYMHHDFTGVVKTEDNGSQPILWPFMNRIINYRWDFDGRKTAYIQMVGNPVNWVLAFVGTLGAWVLVARRRSKLQPDLAGEDANRLEALMIMYVLYWGVHIYLGTQRVMYIYHYFIGLTLAFFMAALVFKMLADRWEWLKERRFYAQLAISGTIALSFLFYAPLTFHSKLSRAECEVRNILFKAVVCQPIEKK